jgi:hypothetical protein
LFIFATGFDSPRRILLNPPVLVVTCTLTFTDGRKVVGRIEAGAADRPYPIAYTGSIDLLEIKYPTGTVSDLIFLFDLVARTTSAKLTVQREGELV